MLINRNYLGCQVVVIERMFCENLRLCLPNLPKEHQNADAMIISLEGVGMIRFAQRHIKTLQDYIGVRTVIFTTKSNLEDWQAARILPQDFAIFVQTPYNKDTMTMALNALLTVAPTAKFRGDEFYNLHFAEDAPKDDFLSDIPIPKAPKNRDHFLHQILDTYFHTKQNEILHNVVQIILAEGPVKITVGRQVVYANYRKNLALIDNKAKLMDYCTIMKTFEVLDCALDVEPISDDVFGWVMNASPNNGYQKHALSALLWQMYSKILPPHIDNPAHSLLLKLRYMPNFSQIDGVSESVRSLLAACLVTPKTIQQLHNTANSDIDKATIHRIFLLAILSGVSDLDVLKYSFTKDKSQAIPSQINAPDYNQGIKKAQASGFLNRLIKVLNTKII